MTTVVGNPNEIVALDNHGQTVAVARRSGPGNLWYVWLMHHRKGYLTRGETPHARVSGKLPEAVQRQLVKAILEQA